MYELLTRTLISIVDDQGEDILVSDRLWAYMSDLYPFHKDAGLERCFKHCIDASYIKRVHSHKGDKDNTIREIKNIINLEETSHKLKKKERNDLIACLTAVSIANGTLSKGDVKAFANTPSSKREKTTSSNTSKTNNQPQSGNQQTPCNRQLTGKVIVSFIVGLLILLFSTYSYSFYLYDGWWMFFVVLIYGIPQFFYHTFLSIFFESSSWKNKDILSLAACCIPILIGMLINGLVPLVLLIDDVRGWVFQYFITGDWYLYVRQWYDSDSIVRVEAPGLFGVFAAAFLDWTLLIVWFSTYSEIKKVLKDPTLKRLLYKSCLLILGIYLILFLWPSICHSYQEYKRDTEQKKEEQFVADMKSRAAELQEERKDMIVPLSFKGIYLDSLSSVCKETALSIDDFEEENDPYTEYKQDLKYKLKEDDRIDLPKAILSLLKDSYRVKNQYMNGSGYSAWLLLLGTTTLDNYPIGVRIMEYDDSVAAIIIMSKDYYTDSYYKFSPRRFEDFDKIIKLYETKYGEPECSPTIKDKSHDRLLSDESDVIDLYSWSFKNGKIIAANDFIIYVSTRFLDHAAKVDEEKNKELARLRKIEKEKQDAKYRAEKAKQDSINKAKREKEFADSLRRARNHAKAINDI